MRTFQNDGSKQYALQNEFTAYLQTAIRRAKARYSRKKHITSSMEIPNDIGQICGIPQTKGDVAFLSLSNYVEVETEIERLELELLMAEMLAQLSEREVTILKGKVFDELTFQELAVRLGIDISTVKSIYYRALKKLRDLLNT